MDSSKDSKALDTPLPAMASEAGLPLSEFVFFGFVPKSQKKLEEVIKKVEKETKTSVFFVSNHKLINFLECVETFLPNRSISICKELTKVNECVFRGIPRNIKNVIMEKEENLKGEFVAVIDKLVLKNQDFDEIDLYKREIKKMTTKFSLTDVVQIVHKFTKINKNKIYKWLLNLKN